MEDSAHEFEFFQSVRILEKLFPESKPVGGRAMPYEEVARFRSRLSLEFPSSEIHAVRTGENENAVEMLVNFMGMVGPSGALPVHYTELLVDRVRYRDTAIWAFLDIFTHRSVSLFYRAWAKYRLPINYERGNDDLTAYMFDLAGLGTNGLRGRMSVPDESMLPYAGLIVQKPHSVNAIQNVIEDYFAVKAQVQQFHGHWLELSADDHTRIGLRRSSLGRSTLLGTRIWDQQSKFRVVLGPLSLPDYLKFLPNGEAHHAVRSIVEFMAGHEFDYDLQLRLARDQVPSTVLTTRAMRKPMLGWTSFLKSLPAADDDEQLVMSVAP